MTDKEYQLEEKVQRVPQGKNGVVEQDLVLIDTANDVDHHVGLHLIQHDPVVVEDNVAGLLRGLVNQTLLECLLRLQIGIRAGRSA